MTAPSSREYIYKIPILQKGLIAETCDCSDHFSYNGEKLESTYVHIFNTGDIIVTRDGHGKKGKFSLHCLIDTQLASETDHLPKSQISNPFWFTRRYDELEYEFSGGKNLMKWSVISTSTQCSGFGVVDRHDFNKSVGFGYLEIRAFPPLVSDGNQEAWCRECGIEKNESAELHNESGGH